MSLLYSFKRCTNFLRKRYPTLERFSNHRHILSRVLHGFNKLALSNTCTAKPLKCFMLYNSSGDELLKESVQDFCNQVFNSDLKSIKNPNRAEKISLHM